MTCFPLNSYSAPHFMSLWCQILLFFHSKQKYLSLFNKDSSFVSFRISAKYLGSISYFGEIWKSEILEKSTWKHQIMRP